MSERTDRDRAEPELRYWESPTEGNWDWMAERFCDAVALYQEALELERLESSAGTGNEDGPPPVLSPHDEAALWRAAMKAPGPVCRNFVLSCGWAVYRVRRENPIGLWVCAGAVVVLAVRTVARALV